MSLVRLREVLLLLAISSIGMAQGLSPTTPALLYVYFGGEAVALEYATSDPIAYNLIDPSKRPENFLTGSPFNNSGHQSTPMYTADLLRDRKHTLLSHDYGETRSSRENSGR